MSTLMHWLDGVTIDCFTAAIKNRVDQKMTICKLVIDLIFKLASKINYQDGF